MRIFTGAGMNRIAAVIAAAVFCAGTPAFAAPIYQAKVTLLANGDYSNELRKGIRGASRRIIFSFYLFKALPYKEPGRVAADLIDAKRRGVDVTVILEKSSDKKDNLNRDNLRTAAQLAAGGVRVLFDSEKRTSHMKVAVIDDRYVFLGSHNLTESALRFNNEISVVIDSPAMAEELTSYLNQL